MDDKKRIPLITRGNICKDKVEDGLSLRPIEWIKQACRLKSAWRLHNKSVTKWIKICKEKYLEEKIDLLIINNLPKGSSFWNELIKVKESLRRNVKLEVNNGESILLWDDIWMGNSPLHNDYNRATEWEKTHIRCWAKTYMKHKIS